MAPRTRTTADMHRRPAVFVDRILQGARPAELPVERPARFELAIGQRAACALGIAAPQTAVLGAAQVLG